MTVTLEELMNACMSVDSSVDIRIHYVCNDSIDIKITFFKYHVYVKTVVYQMGGPWHLREQVIQMLYEDISKLKGEDDGHE